MAHAPVHAAAATVAVAGGAATAADGRSFRGIDLCFHYCCNATRHRGFSARRRVPVVQRQVLLLYVNRRTLACRIKTKCVRHKCVSPSRAACTWCDGKYTQQFYHVAANNHTHRSNGGAAHGQPRRSVFPDGLLQLSRVSHIAVRHDVQWRRPVMQSATGQPRRRSESADNNGHRLSHAQIAVPR